MLPGTKLIISAVVTDPDGIEDLIGGQLLAPSGQAYGSFASSSQEGAYSITLTWQDLNAVEKMIADPVGSRALIAKFFDQTVKDSCGAICSAWGFGACKVMDYDPACVAVNPSAPTCNSVIKDTHPGCNKVRCKCL